MGMAIKAKGDGTNFYKVHDAPENGMGGEIGLNAL